MKTIAIARMNTSYGIETVEVREQTCGRFKGKFFTQAGACGYAGRVAYNTVERVKTMLERDARFAGWQADQSVNYDGLVSVRVPFEF